MFGKNVKYKILSQVKDKIIHYMQEQNEYDRKVDLAKQEQHHNTYLSKEFFEKQKECRIAFFIEQSKVNHYKKQVCNEILSIIESA